MWRSARAAHLFEHAGLTRAKELLVVVGTEGAISAAVRETRSSARRHCVQQRLRSAAEEAGVKEQEQLSFDGPLHDIDLSPQTKIADRSQLLASVR